jgi:hypothetical protein
MPEPLGAASQPPASPAVHMSAHHLQPQHPQPHTSAHALQPSCHTGAGPASHAGPAADHQAPVPGSQVQGRLPGEAAELAALVPKGAAGPCPPRHVDAHLGSAQAGVEGSDGGRGRRGAQQALPMTPVRDDRRPFVLTLKMAASTARQISSVQLRAGDVLLPPQCTQNWTRKFCARSQVLEVSVQRCTVMEWLQTGDLLPAELMQQQHQEGREGCGKVLVIRAAWPLRPRGVSVSTLAFGERGC